MSIGNTNPAARASSRRWRIKTSSPFDALVGAVTIALIALIAYPILWMIVRTFFLENGGLQPFREVFANPRTGAVLFDTGIIIVCAGSIALLIAFTFAWLVERTDARIGWVTSILPLVPLMLPPVAMSVGWWFLAHPRAGFLNEFIQAFLGMFGINLTDGPLNIGSWPGLIFAYVVYLVPFCYLPIAAGLRALDPSLEEAARTSGASVWRTLRDVSLPALKPSIVGAALIATIFAASVFSIPRTLGPTAGVRPISVEIVRLTQTFPSQIHQAVVLAIFVLLIIGTLWYLQRRISARARHATFSGKAASVARIELGKWRPLARAFMLSYIAVAAILPLLGLVIVALQPHWVPQIDVSTFTLSNFASIFEPHAATRAALINSMRLGFLSATLAMAVAVVLVVYMRERRGWLGTIADGTSKLPGAVPNVVLAVGFILALAGPPFRLFGTLTILLLAYVVIFMPQASIAASTSYDQIGGELTEASRVSGAGSGRTLRWVTVPLMRSGIAAGWILIFVVVAGELTASILLSGTGNPVVGFVFLAIWEQGTFSQLAALGTVFATLTSTVVVIGTLRYSGHAGQQRRLRKSRKRSPRRTSIGGRR